MSNLSRQSSLTLGAAASIIVIVVTCSVWIVRSIERLEQRVAALENDSYNMSNASEDVLRNALLNPGLRFSDPRDPGDYISAQKLEQIR